MNIAIKLPLKRDESSPFVNIYDSEGLLVARLYDYENQIARTLPECRELAEFIVQACNCHDAKGN